MNVRHLTATAAVLFATSATPAAWAATPTKPAPKPAPAAQETGRDWSRIDTNRDGLVSPEEMEKWLTDNPGPARK